MQTNGYARRKLCQGVFGQEFDSPRLHHQAGPEADTRSGLFSFTGCTARVLIGIFFIPCRQLQNPVKIDFSAGICYYLHI